MAPFATQHPRSQRDQTFTSPSKLLRTGLIVDVSMDRTPAEPVHISRTKNKEIPQGCWQESNPLTWIKQAVAFIPLKHSAINERFYIDFMELGSLFILVS